MKARAHKILKDKDIQVLIGSLLRWGVLLSMTVVFIGGIIYLYRHGSNVIDYSLFKAEPDFTHNIISMFQGIATLKGRSIIELGILLLIATPIMRVFFSAIGFFIERDYLYVGITLLVLSIIIVSLFGGFGG